MTSTAVSNHFTAVAMPRPAGCRSARHIHRSPRPAGVRTCSYSRTSGTAIP